MSHPSQDLCFCDRQQHGMACWTCKVIFNGFHIQFTFRDLSSTRENQAETDLSVPYRPCPRPSFAKLFLPPHPGLGGAELVALIVTAFLFIKIYLWMVHFQRENPCFFKPFFPSKLSTAIFGRDVFSGEYFSVPSLHSSCGVAQLAAAHALLCTSPLCFFFFFLPNTHTVRLLGGSANGVQHLFQLL